MMIPKVTLPIRTLLFVCLITAGLVFWSTLRHQRETTDSRKVLKELQQTNSALQLNRWNAVFYFCYYGKGAATSDSCHEDPLRKDEVISFPLKNFQTPVLNFEVNSIAQIKQANTVKLKYKFSPEELQKLSQSEQWVLLLPRNSQRATFLGTNMAGESEFGHINDSGFGMSRSVLDKSQAIDLIINYKGLPLFGPLDLPIALVKPDAARVYSDLVDKQMEAAALSKQLLTGLPLVMGAVAAVLDHSPAMILLAAYGSLRAIHSYFGFISESSPLSFSELLINYMSLGASFAVLLMFIEKLMSFDFSAVRLWHRLIFVLGTGIVAVSGQWFIPRYQINSTLMFDTLSAIFGLVLIGFFLSRRWRVKSEAIKTEGPSGQSKTKNENLLSQTIIYAQTLIAASALVVHGSVNGSELLGQLQGVPSFTDPLDWRHMALMPALLTAGLLEVGSVAKRMLSFGQEMAKKAIIEKELKVGHDVQARMLPDKKHKGELWEWRAVYHPAEALAGDWFDIREVQFSTGEILLAVCLADVTGHGVGSSLSTSVICSHWSLWCAQLGKLPYPKDKAEREDLLCSAPLKIHEGLSALRKNENCTALFALIDPTQNEVTICSAGHPGAFLMNPKGLRYLTTAGERLGGELLGPSEWRAKTDLFTEGDLLAIYSDGIVPVGVTVLSWAGQLKKKILSGENRFELILMKTLHDNKRAFLSDPSNEDDMTLILLRLSNPQKNT